MLMIYSNIGFSNNQEKVTLGQKIPSGKISNLFDIPSMSTLPASYKKSQSKQNEFC